MMDIRINGKRLCVKCRKLRGDLNMFGVCQPCQPHGLSCGCVGCQLARAREHRLDDKEETIGQDRRFLVG